MGIILLDSFFKEKKDINPKYVSFYTCCFVLYLQIMITREKKYNVFNLHRAFSKIFLSFTSKIY